MTYDVQPSREARERDAGLRRLSRATIAAGVGSVVAAGALAGYLGLAHPARSATTTVSTADSSSGSTAGSGDLFGSDQNGSATLQPSYSDPSTATSRSHARSGAT